MKHYFIVNLKENKDLKVTLLLYHDAHVYPMP